MSQRPLELQGSGSFASEGLTDGFWCQFGERGASLTLPVSRFILDFLRYLGKGCKLHCLVSSQEASAESSVEDCEALISLSP